MLSILSTLVVFSASGYKFSFKEKKLSKTGLIAVSSLPTGAAIHLNGELSGASNTTLSNLVPGDYNVRITKEGYTPWEKDIKVEEELVTPIEVVLFPSVPELKPLTFSGVVKPQLSPDKSKIAFSLKNGERSGLWVIDMVDRPFAFGKDPRQIIKDTKELLFSDSEYQWSPDSKNILSTIKVGGKEVRNYLLSSDQLNNGSLNDITSNIEETKKTWDKEVEREHKESLASLKTEAAKFASVSKSIDLSPDETKFLAYSDTEAVLYDTKPSPIPNQPDQIIKLPKAKKYIWYPDSKHIILVEDKLISVIDVDGGNKAPIYAGNFEEDAVYSWPNGTKLVIATNFNSSPGNFPNLYAINLR